MNAHIFYEIIFKENKKINLENNDVLIQRIAMFFSVLGDSTRVKIINMLSEEELCVSDIVEKTDISQSAVSHQLRILKQNNLVKFRRDGKNIYYSLDDGHVKDIFKITVEHISHTTDFVEICNC